MLFRHVRRRFSRFCECEVDYLKNKAGLGTEASMSSKPKMFERIYISRSTREEHMEAANGVTRIAGPVFRVNVTVSIFAQVFSKYHKQIE